MKLGKHSIKKLVNIATATTCKCVVAVVGFVPIFVDSAPICCQFVSG